MVGTRKNRPREASVKEYEYIIESCFDPEEASTFASTDEHKKPASNKEGLSLAGSSW